MDRRTFTGSTLGVMGTLALGSVPLAEAAPRTGKPITAAGMARDKKNAVPYARPKGLRNGFDSVDMNEVMVVQQQPAVRVKLESAGKPQAAQLDELALRDVRPKLRFIVMSPFARCDRPPGVATSLHRHRTT
jgi:hypothetical protein